jgi:hypothetical protein
MVDCGIRTSGLGFQVFNAVNDESVFDGEESTVDRLKGLGQRAEFVDEMGRREAPVRNRKIREMLGFREEFPWRTVLGKE